MKKILTGLALTSLMATSAIAGDMKHSVIVGLGGGLQSLKMKVEHSYNVPGGFDNGFSVAEAKFGGTAFFGYRAHMGSFLGGLEVDAITPATFRNTYYNAGANNSDTGYKIKANWAFGASALLGFHVNENAYAAIRLGGEYRKYKVNIGPVTYVVTNRADVEKSYGKFAFAPGILLGTSFMGCWDLSADYRVRLGATKTAGRNTGTNYLQKLKDTNQTFMIKLGYKFGL